MSSKELVDALMADNTLEAEFDSQKLWKNIMCSGWNDLLKAKPDLLKKAKKYKEGWLAILRMYQPITKKVFLL